LEEITAALGLSIKDLFYDRQVNGRECRESMRQRAQQHAARQASYQEVGRRMDALRQAEYLIGSARGLSIDSWSDEQLDEALDRLHIAYALLESEAA
jgi:hypothetical protein